MRESNANKHEHTAPEPLPSSWGSIYPEGDIIAVIDDRAGADSAVRAIEAIGIPADDIFLIEGPRAVSSMEDFREHQRVLGRIGRAISRVMSDSLQFEREYLDEARKGHHLLGVRTSSSEEVERVRPVLHAHQAHHVRHYGPLVVEEFR